MAKYYITEYDYGEDGFKPYNFVTIGGPTEKLRIKSFDLVGQTNPDRQFRWLEWANITMSHWNVTNSFKKSKRSKPSDNQLVVNTSSSKFKIIFLNDSLPTPPGTFHYTINTF